MSQLAACGDEPDVMHVHGSAADSDDDFKGCPADGPRFEPGFSAAGQHFALQLVAAEPIEPERYNNRWTVDVRALDGTTPPDAEIIRGQTFMPIHGHDGRIEPDVTALTEPGRFEIDRLSFTMRGPWEVRLWLASPAVAEERVVFNVCVAK
ncbi:MAG: FixH family protein [Polyangiales bacterium]